MKLILLLLSFNLHATIYKCIDANSIKYQDIPCMHGKQQQIIKPPKSTKYKKQQIEKQLKQYKRQINNNKKAKKKSLRKKRALKKRQLKCNKINTRLEKLQQKSKQSLTFEQRVRLNSSMQKLAQQKNQFCN